MHLRSVYILVYVGFVGLILFLLLRLSVDFHALSPIEVNRVEAESVAMDQLEGLGLDTSELRMMTRRYQRTALYSSKTSPDAGPQVTSPITVRSSGVPLSGWSVMFMGQYEDVVAITSDEVLFNQIGEAILSFDQNIRVRTLRMQPERNKTFVAGEDLIDASQKLIRQFGYDPTQYVLTDTLLLQNKEFDYRLYDNQVNGTLNQSYSLTWSSQGQRGSGPMTMTLSFQPVTRTLEDGQLEIGIKPERFYASYHELDTPELTNHDFDTGEYFISLASLILVLLLVLIAGGRQLFKGEVIWYRTIVITSLSFLGFMGYRVLALENIYFRVLSSQVVALDLFMFGFISMLSSAFVALAYLSWESYARRQDQEQIPHVDAIWRGDVFQQKIGKAVMAGYGYAGMSLAMWAIGLYFFNLVYYQYDSQMGMIDPSSSYPFVTIMLNSWLFTWMTAFSVFALLMSLIMNYVKKSILQVLIGTVLISFLMSQAFMFADVTGTIFQKWIVFALLALPLVLAFKYYGIITVSVALWALFIVVRVFLYFGSMDPVINLNGFFLVGALIAPFGVGVVMYHFGRTSLRDVRFVPEYEQRLKKQMRLEREFQIAKESQYALLPKTAPKIPGVDVKGFFIPSFDVGGDFYEHIIRKGRNGNRDELFLTVVDVSGKGMKAALTAIFTSGLLLSRVKSRDCDPAHIVSDVNDLLHERVDKQTFVTCVLAKYDMETMTLKYVNAGHCQPVLVRNGKGSYLVSSGQRLAMGVKHDIVYTDQSVKLEPGDTVFFYSDGLPEAKTATGSLFEYENVPQLFEKVTREETSSSAICDRIKHEMLIFSNYELADDMTLVVLRV